MFNLYSIQHQITSKLTLRNSRRCRVHTQVHDTSCITYSDMAHPLKMRYVTYDEEQLPRRAFGRASKITWKVKKKQDIVIIVQKKHDSSSSSSWLRNPVSRFRERRGSDDGRTYRNFQSLHRLMRVSSRFAPDSWQSLLSICHMREKKRYKEGRSHCGIAGIVSRNSLLSFVSPELCLLCGKTWDLLFVTELSTLVIHKTKQIFDLDRYS